VAEQISRELLKAIENINELEDKIYKIDGAIFVKKSQKIINEKIAYIYNLLQIEAKSYGQKQDSYYNEVEKIVNNYKQKLYMIYDEYYCQYVNIQNEIQEARMNKKIAMINFQKLMNSKENAFNEQLKKVETLDSKKQAQIDMNEICNIIIIKCENKFKDCISSFENKINSEFLIEASLSVINDNNIFTKIKGKILNIIYGKKNYMKVLENYNLKVNSIDVKKEVSQIRENIVDFVTEILELKSENGLLKEAV
jgi:chaperonin cofactor prefoldin